MQQTTLSNGLTIITENVPTIQSVTLSYFIKAGSYQEKNYPKGIAHYIEHMLFKGTKTRNANEINELFDYIGSSVNAYTSYTKTKFYCQVPYDQWKTGTEILNDLVWNHTLPTEEIEKERTVILEEIKMYDDDPSSLAFEQLNYEIYKNNEERQSIIGTPESVNSIQRDDMVRFINEFYQPNNLVFVATGNIDHDALVDYLSAFEFTRTGTTTVEPSDYVQVPQKRNHIQSTRDIQQAHLAFLIDAPTNNDEDRFAMNIISKILGGSMSSRLFRIIREEMGLAYSVSTGLSNAADYGFVQGYVGTDPKNLDTVKEVVINEFERLKTEPVSAYELQKAINFTKGTFMLSLEKTNTLNEFYANNYLNGKDANIEEVIAKYEAVTAADIQRVANKYFNAEHFLFSEVVPKN